MRRYKIPADILDSLGGFNAVSNSWETDTQMITLWHSVLKMRICVQNSKPQACFTLNT